MRTIKSIVKEYNRNYKVNYDATLSRNNIGFTIVDTEAQDLDNEKENIDIKNLDIDLDFIDIKLLVNDYKSEIINKCLKEIMKYNKKNTEDNNLLDFNNFIVNKRYDIVKKKIEEEKNFFIQEREKRFDLLSDGEKNNRLLKDKKIGKYIKKYKSDKNYINQSDLMSACISEWDKLRDKSINLRLQFINEFLNKDIFDNNYIENKILYYFNKKNFNIGIIKNKLKKYTKFINKKNEEQSIEKKFELLTYQYYLTKGLREKILNNEDDNFLSQISNDNMSSFYEERKNEINQRLDEIDGKVKQGELETSEIEDSKERQALITEINEKSSTLKSLQE